MTINKMNLMEIEKMPTTKSRFCKSGGLPFGAARARGSMTVKFCMRALCIY